MRSKAGRRTCYKARTPSAAAAWQSAVVDATDTYRITQNLPFGLR